MHAFKTLLVASALAVTAAPNLRAADTAEEQQLREALRKAQAASNGQQTTAPAPSTTAPAVKPAAAQAPATSENDAALREALRKAQAGSSEQQTVAPADMPKAAPAMATPTPAPVMQPVVKAAPAESFSTVPPSGSDDEVLRRALRQEAGGAAMTSAQSASTDMAAPPGTFSAVPDASGNDEALRAALRQRMSEPEPMPAAETPVAMTKKETTKPKGMAKPTPIELAPLPKPELPISMTKEERLSNLLKLYKANVITPAQYHEQRAAILAEP